VSFNIARVRTTHEPNSSGWGNITPNLFASDGSKSSRCSVSPESGCQSIKYTYSWRNQESERELHVAGQGCVFDLGYSGWRISPLEMRGMNLPRYVVEKPENSDHYVDEEMEEYERVCDFFVTDCTKEPVDNNEPREFQRQRFDVSHGRAFLPQNYDVMGDGRRFGIPVDDSCWRIFERVCRLRLGRVDLQGLVALWWVSNGVSWRYILENRFLLMVCLRREKRAALVDFAV
jgi:hypothetical protein